MTAFKRKDRPNEGYRISPRLPKPWGRVGPWQTGLHRKAQADMVEAWVHEMALTRPAIVDGLCEGRFSLREAWIAKLRGTLEQLVQGINDPLITAAVETFRPECTDTRTLQGLDQLLEHTEKGLRLSWLAGKNIQGVYRRALADRKPNSVYRSLHLAVSALLTYHLKRAGRNAAFEGVTIPRENDTRVVHVTGDELKAVLDHCGVIRSLAVAAVTTAIDVGPLLRMTPRHLHELEGFIDVHDTKNPSRPRKLRVSEAAWVAFRTAALGKQLDEQLWTLSYRQTWAIWTKAAKDGGRPGLRLKDLRHVLPTIMAEQGVDRRSIQAYLGHAQGSKSTDRYITPTGDVAMLDAAVDRLGLSHLRAG